MNMTLWRTQGNIKRGLALYMLNGEDLFNDEACVMKHEKSGQSVNKH